MKIPFSKIKGYYFLLTLLISQLCISNKAVAQQNDPPPNLTLVAPTLETCACGGTYGTAYITDDQSGYSYTYQWSATNLCASSSIGGQGTYSADFELSSTSTLKCLVSWSDPNDANNSGSQTLSASVPIDNISAKISGPTAVSCSSSNKWTASYTGTPDGTVVYKWSVPPGWSAGTNSATYTPATIGSAGVISVAVCDNICCSYASISVTVPTPPSNPVISGPTAVCTSGGTTTVTYSVPTVSGATYSWSGTRTSGTGTIILQGPPTSQTNSIQFTGAGVFNVCLTEKGGSGICAYSVQSCITVTTTNAAPSAPTLLYYTAQGTTCYFNANIGAVSGATGYVWSGNSSFVDNNIYYEVTSLPNTEGAQQFDGTTTYTLYVEATNVCGSGPYHEFVQKTPAPANKTCAAIVVKDTNQSELGENEIALADYKIYPNPVSSRLTVEYPYSSTSNQVLSIYDMLGKKVASYELPASQSTTSLNVSTLPAGLFVYSISSGDNIVQRGKIMVQR